MSVAERFAQARPRLIQLAYSELGDIGEAEDVVQEAWLRLERTDVRAIENLGGWLTTVVARLALDRLRSARAPGDLCRPMASGAARIGRPGGPRHAGRVGQLCAAGHP
nr:MULTISPECIES: sigma factor [Protofrankia]